MNNKRILLLNDNAKRDLLSVRLLENALKSRGFKTAICNSQTVRVKLRQFRPHAFITARGDHSVAREVSALCRVYVVAGEGGQQTKETMLSVFMGRGYWKLDSVDWISRCYLWSERTREWLMETGIFKEQQLPVVGNPRLDLYRNCKLTESISKKGGQFRLGVAFSAKSTSTYYGHPHFASVYHQMHSEMTFPITQPGRHFEDIVWRDHAILRNMMRSLRLYLENSQGEVWLRPSPFESPNEYTFLEKAYPGRIRVLSNQTLPEFLYGVDAVLTCWSTVGIECLIIEKPVISIAGLIDQDHLFRHISPKSSGFETFVKFYHRPATEKALLDLLREAEQGRLVASPEPRGAIEKLLKDIYSWPGREGACELIAEDIARDIYDAPDHGVSEWKKILPLRYEIPLPLASLAVTLRTILSAFRSGEFNAYWDFFRNTDPAVEKLLRQISN